MRLVTHLALLGLAGLALATVGAAPASRAADEKAVADLDTQYQAAVEKNDAETMARILLDDFVLVVGNGTVYNKADLIKSAKDRDFVWEHQVEEAGTQKVRVWGDTAVVTAKLWLKGTSGGKPVDKKLWFSDTYVRTPQGWRYFFGQASLGLPPSP
jgi:ketosteroid isomerase-like protein